MNKIIVFFTSLLFVAFSYAHSIEGVGNVELLLHDGNTLLLFQQIDKNAEIKSKIGLIDWYQLPDTITPITSGTDYLYPEHGVGYMIKNGNGREYFWVFDYDSIRLQITDATATLTCENTTINLLGNIPELQYTTPHGVTNTYPRTCQVIYLDQQWFENQWIDSIATTTVDLQNTLVVGASPVATDFTVEYSLINEQGLTYSDVAKRYQEMLYGTVLDQTQPDQTNSTVLNAEYLGLYDYKTNFLGVVYNGHDSLTTYSQAITVTKQLKDWGAEHINVMYLGWQKSGLVNETFNDMSFTKKLGNKDELQDMLDEMEDGDVENVISYKIISYVKYTDDQLEQATESLSEYTDIDEDEVAKYNVGDILPVFIFFDGDKEITRVIGEVSEKEMLNKLREAGLINEESN